MHEDSWKMIIVGGASAPLATPLNPPLDVVQALEYKRMGYAVFGGALQ